MSKNYSVTAKRFLFYTFFSLIIGSTCNSVADQCVRVFPFPIVYNNTPCTIVRTLPREIVYFYGIDGFLLIGFFFFKFCRHRNNRAISPMHNSCRQLYCGNFAVNLDSIIEIK